MIRLRETGTSEPFTPFTKRGTIMLQVKCDFCPSVFDGTWEMALCQGWKSLFCDFVVPDKKPDPFLDGHACPSCVERIPQTLRHAVLPESVTEQSPGAKPPPDNIAKIPTLKENEKHHILTTLELTGRNKSKAAQTLGMERSTLDRKLKRYAAEQSAS